MAARGGFNALQRHYRIVEGRVFRRRRNGLDLRNMVGHGVVEGRPEMLRPDRGEGRRLVGRSPSGEQRVGRFMSRVGADGHFAS